MSFSEVHVRCFLKRGYARLTPVIQRWPLRNPERPAKTAVHLTDSWVPACRLWVGRVPAERFEVDRSEVGAPCPWSQEG